MTEVPSDSSNNMSFDEVNKSRLNVAKDIDGNVTQTHIDVFNGNITNNKNITNNFFGDSDRKSSTLPPTKILSHEEHRQRKVLLNKVRNIWIKEVLERSLYHKTLIELGLETRLDTLGRPVSFDGFSPQTEQKSANNSNLEKLFADIGDGRTLLILGEPGAGKTTMLCKLVQSLISQTEEDLTRLIPVVFNLSSWSNSHKSIVRWLVKELDRIYNIPESLGKKWIEEQALLLLLDGLDEVNTYEQNMCVRAINDFLQNYGQTEIVVSSRTKDYLALSDRLKLQSAICVQSLTIAKIEIYFNSIAPQGQLDGLKTLLQEDKVLQEMAYSPLILNIMMLTYKEKSIVKLPQQGSVEERTKYLFDNYLEVMFARINQKNRDSEGVRVQYSDSKVKYWLSWLAKQMQHKSQTIFFIESIQSSWLTLSLDRRLYDIGSRLFPITLWGVVHVGLLAGHGKEPATFAINDALLGMFMGALGGILYGILAGLSVGIIKNKIVDRLFNGLLLGLIFALIFWFFYKGGIGGIAFGVVYFCLGFFSLYEAFNCPIEPVEILKISWKKIRKYCWFGFVIAIALSFLDTPFLGSVYGCLIVLAMFSRERVPQKKRDQIQEKTFPNQGMWKSWKQTYRIFIGFGLVSGFLYFSLSWYYVSGFVNGIIFGVASSLITAQNSGIVCLKHLVLRSILFGKGYAPWNYAKFLDYAQDCLFIQRVGGGYIFYHRLLLEYFAKRNFVKK